VDGDAVSGEGYAGGEENRCGDAAVRVGDSFKRGVAGSKDVVYVRGPVLCVFVGIGGGIVTFLWGSLSTFVVDICSISTGGFSIPFVDATEFRSPFGSLPIPLCGTGLLLPFSFIPFMPPLTERALLLRDDR
jgi:hypothetical protein